MRERNKRAHTHFRHTFNTHQLTHGRDAESARTPLSVTPLVAPRPTTTGEGPTCYTKHHPSSRTRIARVGQSLAHHTLQSTLTHTHYSYRIIISPTDVYSHSHTFSYTHAHILAHSPTHTTTFCLLTQKHITIPAGYNREYMNNTNANPTSPLPSRLHRVALGLL